MLAVEPDNDYERQLRPRNRHSECSDIVLDIIAGWVVGNS